MTDWKRTIPRVTAATLVLGGTSCGGKSPTIQSVARLSCLAYRQCDPSDFYYYYDTLQQCTAEYAADLYEYRDSYEYYYGFPISARCENAFLDYLDCYYSEYRQSCSGAQAEAACIRENDRVDANCLF